MLINQNYFQFSFSALVHLILLYLVGLSNRKRCSFEVSTTIVFYFYLGVSLDMSAALFTLLSVNLMYAYCKVCISCILRQ